MEPDVNQNIPGATPGTTDTSVSGIGTDAVDAKGVDTTPVYGTTGTAYATTDPADVSATGDAVETKEQWQKIGEQTSTFLSELPSYVSEFFGQYRRPITTIGLILGTILAVKVGLAILDAINDVPLMSPIFELIGIGYSIWFVYRYLLKASDRAELSEDFAALKAQVLGGTDRLLDRFSSDEKIGS